MRKLSMLAFLAVTTASSAALAAPRVCTDPLPGWLAEVKTIDDANKKIKDTTQHAGLPELVLDGNHLDCIKDEVLVINGEGIITCPMDGMMTPPKYKTDDCTLDYAKAIAKALQVIGPVPDTQWDQLVIFGQQTSKKTDPPAPLFYREGFSAGGGIDPVTMMPLPGSPGVNEVGNIGLGAKTPRVAGKPYVGYIAAGGTNQAAKFTDSGLEGWLKKIKKDNFSDQMGAFGPCGKAGKTAADPPGDQKAAALCFPSFYNFFDALAQATASLFGPALKGPKDAPGNSLVVSAIIGSGNATASVKDAFVLKQEMPDPADPTKKVPVLDPMTMKPIVTANPAFLAVNPRFWNSFLDTQGSLFAGNTYRNNSNGTYETTKPSPFYGINVPFPAGWKAGTVLSGSQVLRFQPLDLYVMGLLPSSALPPQLRYFANLNVGSVYKDGRANAPTSFDKTAGPQMGQRTGLILRPGSAEGGTWVKSADIITANMERDPPYGAAPQYIKQLWIVVSKPAIYTEQAPKDNDDLMIKRANGLQHLDVVASWRRQFAAYYHMLTQYRGRVVNTFGGADDNAYFEFGHKGGEDTTGTFTAENGAVIEQPGWEPATDWVASGVNVLELQNVLRFTSAPAGGSVRYVGKAPALRIAGDQSLSRTPVNSVTVRMRVPLGSAKNAAASLTLDNGPTVRIPAAPGNLVPDGKWHTYVAVLPAEEFKAADYAGFSFTPTDKGADGIEVEFIRIANVPSTKDADKIGQKCGECSKLAGASKTKCTSQCAGKDDTFITTVDQSDGWIDAEDNCPAVFNPLQEDGNNDGIGDACEDFDADGVFNAWDNCPTTTNSRQVDKDGNGVGDVCDGSQTTPCFLKPDSLAGPGSAGPGTLLGVLLAGSIGVLAFRRRRRR